jgi:hypothetical protein
MKNIIILSLVFIFTSCSSPLWDNRPRDENGRVIHEDENTLTIVIDNPFSGLGE